MRFDGKNISVKSDSRAILQNISSDNGVAKILAVMNGKEIKAAIAQKNPTITVGDDAADIYVGKNRASTSRITTNPYLPIWGTSTISAA